eukprot:Lithocolla_globosa_v1_NODE_1375_length_2623_cov_5.572819.p1 type:complete len:264 gc:universal NODE_1375_length_2623_cov_5.572819:1707-2498(+)
MSAHDLAPATFTKPQTCAMCCEFIYGFRKQGIQCSICHQAYHHKCQDAAKRSECALGADVLGEGQEALFKVGLLGPPKGGKTALCNRFIDNTFRSEYNATFEDLYVHRTSVQGRAANVQLADIGGELTSISMLKEVHGAMIVFSMLDQEGFDGLDKFYELMRKEIRLPNNFLIVATHMDQPGKKVSEQDVQKLATFWGCNAIFTSAKEGTGVSDAFNQILEVIVGNPESRASNPGGTFRVSSNSGTTRRISNFMTLRGRKSMS